MSLTDSLSARSFLQLKNDHSRGQWYQRAYALGWHHLQDLRNEWQLKTFLAMECQRMEARRFVAAMNAMREQFDGRPALLRPQV